MSPTDHSLDDLITGPEAADLMKRDVRTVRAWIRKGRIAGKVLSGRQVVVLRSSIPADLIVSSPTLDGTPVANEETAA